MQMYLEIKHRQFWCVLAKGSTICPLVDFQLHYELSLNTQELRLFYCLIANILIFVTMKLKNIGLNDYISGLTFHVRMI